MAGSLIKYGFYVFIDTFVIFLIASNTTHKRRLFQIFLFLSISREGKGPVFKKIAELLFLVQFKGVYLHPVASLHGFIAVSARCLFSLHAGFTA